MNRLGRKLRKKRREENGMHGDVCPKKTRVQRLKPTNMIRMIHDGQFKLICCPDLCDHPVFKVKFLEAVPQKNTIIHILK